MASVKKYDLELTIPNDLIPITALQAHISLTQYEPFKWSNQGPLIQDQLEAITRTLELSKNESRPKGPIIIFPEYSIPGEIGAQAIDDTLSSPEWPANSMVIAGLHGLTQTEYSSIVNNFSIELSDEDSPKHVSQTNWVNFCIVWVKETNGNIRRVGQLKIKPARDELNTSFMELHGGNFVNLFSCKYENGHKCNFLIFICFDWQAGTGPGNTVYDDVMTAINHDWAQSGIAQPLHYVFVIQHNPKPSHKDFLHSTFRFLVQTHEYNFIDRRASVVFHINSASSVSPSRSKNGGITACTFSPMAVLDHPKGQPTYTLESRKLRESDILENCKDAIFRETGACIHSFKLRVPQFYAPTTQYRSPPLLHAKVHSIGTSTDPRLSCQPVAASVKWLNDEFELLDCITENDLRGCPLEPNAVEARDYILPTLKTDDGAIANLLVNNVACVYNSTTNLYGNFDREKNADCWETECEGKALECYVNTLVMLGVSYKVSNEQGIAYLRIEGRLPIAIIAILGRSFEDCLKHFFERTHDIVDSIFVIFRDNNNNALTTHDQLRITDGGKISGIEFVDYSSISHECRSLDTVEFFRNYLNDKLPGERKIF